LRGLGGVGGGLVPGDAVGQVHRLREPHAVPRGAQLMRVAALEQLTEEGSGSGWGARGRGLTENRSLTPAIRRPRAPPA